MRNRLIVIVLNSLMLIFIIGCTNIKTKKQKSNLIIVQPIITQSDLGLNPAKINTSKNLVDKAYSKADINFHYLEPIFFNNTAARDGLINLDSIVKIAHQSNLFRGQNDIINMFFVNAIDGNQGPTGRGMMNGNIVFIALGDKKKSDDKDYDFLQAFVVAHEVGHNLGLKHVIDDPNVIDSLPNIQGDGAFKDRIDPNNSLNQYQIKEIQKSPLVHSRIEFLKKSEGEIAILDETFEPYFSQLQVKEISTFVQEKAPQNIQLARVFAKDKFSSAVKDFSENEKEIISFVVKKINEWLLKNELNLMANHPWRFIKVQNWLCGGFAHTRGTYIILSQAYLDRLSKEWSKDMDKESESKLILSLGGLLVHEQMHSLQRTFKSKFDKLYSKNWGFLKHKMPNEIEITRNQVSNPDAPVAEWLIPDPNLEKKFYLARTLITKDIDIPVMGKDFEDLVFEIEKKDSIYSFVRINNVITSKPLSELDFYTRSFPVKRGLDHPNEISAYMFSDFFKTGYHSKNPFLKHEKNLNKNLELFLNWIKTEMKKS